MKRLLIIMLTICVWTNKVRAQFHSMNYDKETVAAWLQLSERKPWQKAITASR